MRVENPFWVSRPEEIRREFDIAEVTLKPISEKDERLHIGTPHKHTNLPAKPVPPEAQK